MWTLLYNGVEKKMSDWHIARNLTVNFRNKEKSTLTFYTTENFDPISTQFEFDQPVVIYKDRTAVGSGGNIFFQGRFDSPRRGTSGAKQNIYYTIHDFWWLAEREIFKQVQHVFAGWLNGDATQGAVFTDFFLPSIVLGEAVNGQDVSFLNVSDQLVEIVNWLNTAWNATRRGNTSEIDVSQDICQLGNFDTSLQVEFPKQPCQSLYCKDAVVDTLRWVPTSVLARDLSTTPPTFNVVDMQNMPEIEITLTEEQEREIEATSQDMRCIPGVILTYKRIDENNGKRALVITVDKYPSGVTEYIPEVLSMQFNLMGFSSTSQTQTVEVDPISNLLSGNAEAQKAWWLAHDKSLNKKGIDQNTISIESVEVTDIDGNSVDVLQYPNELIKGPILDWMNEGTIDVDIVSAISWTQYGDDDHKVKTGEVTREVHCKRVLTTATSKTYSIATSSTTGEVAPIGIAERVYNSLKDLEYAGHLTIPKEDVRNDIKIGTRLKLIGPHTTFSNCIVQSVTLRPGWGETDVVFGPLDRLDAQGLLSLYMTARQNHWFDIPSRRANGGI